MNFTLIGTGNTAWFLAKRLTNAGHTCMGIYGRDKSSANTLADTIQCSVYHAISDIADDADVCIIAVSDHAIAEVAAQLAFKNTVIIHTAGSVNSDVLSTSSEHYGVLWPIYSIIKTDLPEHKNIPTVWEASDARSKELIQALGNSFSDMLFFADSEQRLWLHLSAVMSNNFINHLLAICEQVCEAHHVPFPLLFPIIIQTLDRVTANSPFDLQTGPAKRGDTVTMQKHMDMLQQKPDWKAIYKSISDSIGHMYLPKP